MAPRNAIFAGSWYPAKASRCKLEILDFLKQAADPIDAPPPYYGGIVPHAGWFFSGAISCRVIKLLAEGTPPDAIILFGMHLRPGAANHIMTGGSWQTPFGELPIASELATALTGRFGFKIETAENFTPDNTIELQLPFIKYFFGDIPIVPIGVSPGGTAPDIGTAAAALAADMGLSVKVLGTTDLTHYGPNYGFTPQGRGEAAVRWVREENDRSIIKAMIAMDPEQVLHEAANRLNACCSGAVAAAIAAARHLGARQGHTVSYATSYDKSPGDSLVGYVGIVY